MKTKLILSVAAAAALFAANPAMNKADASTIQTKVYYYQSGNLNNMNVESILQKYFKNYQISWKQAAPVQKNIQKQAAPQPNKAEKPVKVQEPAKAPAPVQKEAKAQAPAPVQKPAKAQAPAPVQAPAKSPSQESAVKAPASSAVSAYEQKVVELTNQERAKNGLKPLALDTELSKVAREKSRDMQSKGYFSHTSPTYGSPFDMMKQFGINYRSAGENIAMGQPTPEEVVKAWMNSSGHRANILNSSYTHIGVGHVANGNYWTQMFIGK
ncbi:MULTISPECIES: CAP domain-containing protein [Mesobacillus]|uniref:Sporulation protein n=2 Tax=Mesobacillus TaxID=2675231 RepID=A0A0D6Z8P1_9BACI|nr:MULTISPECIES: CAP domain-containing protein [Mesobacillus]KIY21361.1 sporulation protein [Mesobacillus subterraneus]MDQ0411958.1 putative YkwD family protein [Mesobacillus stamsii]